MSRRLRLVLLIVGGVLLTLAAAAAMAIYILLQPERFTAMLQAQARAAGLELHLSSPASPSLFPRPALDLHGITLNARGATAPILLAARGRLALPWRALLGGPQVITQLQIDSPRVDLGALQAWLAALPPNSADKPMSIPRIDTGVRISRGSIVSGNQLLLGNVALEAGSLISGQPFPLTITADPATGVPLMLHLTATPRIHGSSLRLDQIALQLEQDNTLKLRLGGHLRWHGAADAAATLSGTLTRTDSAPYTISVVLTPADQVNPLLLALKLDGPGDHADLDLPPLALMQWWDALGSSGHPQVAMPPISGNLDIAHIASGSVTIEGLTLQAGDDVPAASTSTTEATATGVKPGTRPGITGKP